MKTSIKWTEDYNFKGFLDLTSDSLKLKQLKTIINYWNQSIIFFIDNIYIHQKAQLAIN